MALAHAKTWTFYKQETVYNGSSDNMERAWWFGLKNLLFAMGWTAEGGRSASIGLHNNDQVDVWPTLASITRASGDMWANWKAPVALGGIEIVISSLYSSGDTYLNRMGMGLSHEAGYGTVNGGTNGTTTAVPTATDNVTIQSHNVSSQTIPTGGGNTQTWYGAVSADGKSHRIWHQQGHTISAFLIFDHLTNPHVNLDNGGRVMGGRFTTNTTTPSNSVLDNDWYTSALIRGRVSGINRNLYIGTHGYANLGHQSLRSVRADRKMVVSPCDIYNSTLDERGYYGTIADLYWGNNGHYTVLVGDTVGAVPQWISGGGLILPWDGTEQRPRTL